MKAAVVYLLQFLLVFDLLFLASVFVLHWTAYFGFLSAGDEPNPATQKKNRWMAKYKFVYTIILPNSEFTSYPMVKIITISRITSHREATVLLQIP